MTTYVRIIDNTTTVKFPTSLPGPPGESANRTGCVMVSGSESGALALSTGNSKAVVRVNADLNGMILSEVGAGVSAPSSSGVVTVQIRRLRNGTAVNMLSTVISIDASEYDSTTAASQAVINTANDDVQTGDMLHIDVTGAGTGVRGLVVSFGFTPA